MDINELLKEYDNMFARNTPDEISEFLQRHIEEARKAGDNSALLALLNEQIGFARDRVRRDEALTGCGEIRLLLDEMELKGTIHYGKSLLNIANAYRAFGLYDDAQALFDEVEKLYISILPEGDYNYAPLYNNWSLLALSMGDSRRAADLIRLSIAVIDRYDGAVIEQSTSRVNLAYILLDIASRDEGCEDLIAEAEGYLNEAIERFEAEGGRDYHFASALSAKGDLLMNSGDPEAALESYTRALELISMYTGSKSRMQALETKIAAAKSRLNR